MRHPRLDCDLHDLHRLGFGHGLHRDLHRRFHHLSDLLKTRYQNGLPRTMLQELSEGGIPQLWVGSVPNLHLPESVLIVARLRRRRLDLLALHLVACGNCGGVGSHRKVAALLCSRLLMSQKCLTNARKQTGSNSGFPRQEKGYQLQKRRAPFLGPTD